MMGLYANKKHIGLTSASETISLVFYIYVEPSDAGKIYRMGDQRGIQLTWYTWFNNQSIKRLITMTYVFPIYKYLSEIINVWKYLVDTYC